ncbi:hypothetical protein M413DRAFT_129962 [Hebeloma cylindrosporum]|uniref:F-box domain-containing protein n=1 Tax=Hebeloma cylindrosporum TaxID=76867 RepID=A0A0C2YMM2_HEBCY|nr:hypothetical protein M413DRAFT_129962 [Hebeloma cylindrosporum h7]
MRSTLILPLEIEEIILNFLAEDDNNHSALKACSLVCQAFLPICRKHIFGSIVINDTSHRPVPAASTYAFQRLLRDSPEITDYIRKLDYTFEFELFESGVLGPGYSDSPPYQESLEQISRLEFLTVRNGNWAKFDWNNNPIRPALLHLLHLPTLSHLNVTSFNNFMLSDLIPCVNLKYLHICLHTTGAAETTFPSPSLPEHPPIQLKEFITDSRTGDVVTQIFAARRTDGQRLIDFGSLAKITMNIDRLNICQTSQELFQGCQSLIHVNISFWDRRWYVRPSLADMLRPSMQTLKHIVVNFDIYGVDADPLIGIPSDLEDMRTRNIIESVTIGVMVQTDQDCRRGDEWGRLDEVLTSPGWSSLQRVSLTTYRHC